MISLLNCHGAALIIFLAHGCVQSLISTIGEERRTNPALLIKDRDEFIRYCCEGLPPAPAYFPHVAHLNKTGGDSVEALTARARDLSLDQLQVCALLLQIHRLLLVNIELCGGLLERP